MSTAHCRGGDPVARVRKRTGASERYAPTAGMCNTVSNPAHNSLQETVRRLIDRPCGAGSSSHRPTAPLVRRISRVNVAQPAATTKTPSRATTLAGDVISHLQERHALPQQRLRPAPHLGGAPASPGSSLDNPTETSRPIPCRSARCRLLAEQWLASRDSLEALEVVGDAGSAAPARTATASPRRRPRTT